MSPNNPDIPEIISTDLFRRLRSLKLIDEVELRNQMIRYDYRQLRLKNSASICIQILMEKYSLSDSTLNSILFRNKKNKTKIPLI